MDEATRARRAAATELAERSVTVHMPAWAWGGDPAGLAAAAKWTTAELPGGGWAVRLTERARRRPGRLVQVGRLANAGNVDARGAFALLAGLPPQSRLVATPADRVNTELERLAGLPGLPPRVYALGLATATCHERDLPGVVRDALRVLLDIEPLDRAPAAYLVSVDAALSYRYSATRLVLLAADTEGGPALEAHIASQGQSGAPPLRSARGLNNDILFGLKAYLAPLLLSVSPWVWASLSARAGGVVVYTYGAAVSGRDGHTAELLQEFHPAGRTSTGPRPSLGPGQLDAALRWYVAQLDLLFTEITDPANHRDSTSGAYQPRRQFEVQLSVEQAFRDVEALGALDRDRHSQRVLMLDTFDTLEGLRLPGFEQMATLTHARRALADLEAAVPAAAADVLLPRARRAVQALERLQDGFFLRTPDGGVRVPVKGGTPTTVSLERAAAGWLRALRNAGHSFTGKQDAGRDRDKALLLAHDGEVPDALPDLAWLYLLRLIAHPEHLRRRR